MKNKILISLYLLFAGTVNVLHMNGSYETSFEVPPYAVNETIIGTDGWVTSSGASIAGTGALVVQSPWDSSGYALRLNRGSEPSGQVRAKNSSFSPLSGEHVQIAVGMAFNFNPSTNSETSSGFAFKDLSLVSSPIAFGLDYSVVGGLYYTDANGTKRIVLAKAQIKMNSVYDFIITLDQNAATPVFDIQISGLEIDDTPFLHTMSGLSAAGLATLDTIYVGHSANNNFTAYVDYISVQPIPEPALVSLLVVGALALGIRLRRR